MGKALTQRRKDAKTQDNGIRNVFSLRLSGFASLR
jgi:hypothetical protein